MQKKSCITQQSRKYSNNISGEQRRHFEWQCPWVSFQVLYDVCPWRTYLLRSPPFLCRFPVEVFGEEVQRPLSLCRGLSFSLWNGLSNSNSLVRSPTLIKMENDTINHIDTILDESSNLTYNSTLQELCPDYTKDQLKMLDDVAFWLDGVAKSMTALLGIFSNILAAYVLNRPKMKNSFNLCLVALACIDTIYLFLQFLESLRKR